MASNLLFLSQEYGLFSGTDISKNYLPMTLKINIATMTMTVKVVLQIQTRFLQFFEDYFSAAKKCCAKPNTAYLFNTLRKLVIIRSGMLNSDMACKILDPNGTCF